MKRNYEIPKIEVIEIELESILCESVAGGSNSRVSASSALDDGSAW